MLAEAVEDTKEELRAAQTDAEDANVEVKVIKGEVQRMKLKSEEAKMAFDDLMERYLELKNRSLQKTYGSGPELPYRPTLTF